MEHGLIRPGQQMQKPQLVVEPSSTLRRSDSSASRLARAADQLRKRYLPIPPEPDNKSTANLQKRRSLRAGKPRYRKLIRNLVTTSADAAALADVRIVIEELHEYLRTSKVRLREQDEKEETKVCCRSLT